MPTSISGARGALKVDGLDSFNPSANLKIDRMSARQSAKP
jgi:hypothetical protein